MVEVEIDEVTDEEASMIKQYMDEFEDEDISPEVVNPVVVAAPVSGNPVPMRIRPAKATRTPMVDARSLWEELGSQRGFSNWISHQIERFGLVEHKDYERVIPTSGQKSPMNMNVYRENQGILGEKEGFTPTSDQKSPCNINVTREGVYNTHVTNSPEGVFAPQGENSSGFKTRIDYLLTLEAANRIRAGKKENQEFIAQTVADEETKKAEARVAVEGNPLVRAMGTIQNLMGALQQNNNLLQQSIDSLTAMAEVVQEQQLKIENDKPKVTFAEAVEVAHGNLDVGDAAKALKVGPNKLFAWMRDKKILMSNHNDWNRPYQRYIEQGYLDVTITVNNEHTHIKPLVTPKGIIWLSKLLKLDEPAGASNEIER